MAALGYGSPAPFSSEWSATTHDATVRTWATISLGSRIYSLPLSQASMNPSHEPDVIICVGSLGSEVLIWQVNPGEPY